MKHPLQLRSSGQQHALCFYHAGIFAGILSGLINRNLDSFETECCAAGDKVCRFTLGDSGDKDIKTRHAAYIAAPVITTDLAARLENSLAHQPARALGNLVDVNYYRLVMASTLLADPQRSASTNFEVGSKLGRRLAPALAKFYGREGLQNMREYYSQLGEFKVEVRGDEVQLELVITEAAEAIGPVKTMEMLSFLLGELQSLTSVLTGKEVVIRESRFEGEKLVLDLGPAG